MCLDSLLAYSKLTIESQSLPIMSIDAATASVVMVDPLSSPRVALKLVDVHDFDNNSFSWMGRHGCVPHLIKSLGTNTSHCHIFHVMLSR